MGMRQTELRQPGSANRICRVAAYLNEALVRDAAKSAAPLTFIVERLVNRNALGYSSPGDSRLQAQGVGQVLRDWIQRGHPNTTHSTVTPHLGRLNVATSPKDMALPGLELHPLKGERKGTWAVSVSGNWRVTFTFVGKDADSVDYEDYH